MSDMLIKVIPWSQIRRNAPLDSVKESIRDLDNVYTEVVVDVAQVSAPISSLTIVGAKVADYQCAGFGEDETSTDSDPATYSDVGTVVVLIDSNGDTWISDHEYERFCG